MVLMSVAQDDDDDGPELFIAQPADEIPKNKLTDRLARGLQGYVQRMQKRLSFYAELTSVPHQRWMPAPREYSTLTYCNNRCYLNYMISDNLATMY